nr:hypothetical protein [Aeromonas veronii]
MSCFPPKKVAARLPIGGTMSKLTVRLVVFTLFVVQPNQKPSPARLGFVFLELAKF